MGQIVQPIKEKRIAREIVIADNQQSSTVDIRMKLGRYAK